MYSVDKLKIWNIAQLLQVSNILYRCGKDMAAKYDLHHWDNSYVKSLLIVMICALKNDIYLIRNDGKAVATFQNKMVGDALLLSKLAILPAFAKHGIGSYCLQKNEEIGREKHCTKVVCDVYNKSEAAICFYEHRGYTAVGTAKTRKYGILKMCKAL